MVKYDRSKNRGSVSRNIDKIVGEVGSVTETGGLVKNDAALKVSHLLGDKTAQMLGETLEELRLAPQQYSVVFKDKGLRLKAVGAIGEKARVTEFPVKAGEVYHEFDTFMNYCDVFMICPTLGLFAAWLGSDIDGLEKHIAHYRTARPDVADALDLAKELIRGFLETKTIDGDIAPAVYLHQNKAYFGAVETSAVKHVSQTDAHVRDSEQIAEVIDLLPDSVKAKLED